MTSSGMKRGLAATAVSALAVTGLPFLTATANADSLESQMAANTVDLLSQYSNTASVKNDGQNTTVHLLANGGTGVQQVRFEYQVGLAAPVVIDTVARSNGAFSAEWAPATSLYGQTVTVRAVGLNNSGGEIETLGGSDQNTTVVVSAAAEAIDISNAPGSSVGYFTQPYGDPNDESLAVVSGTTSDVSASPTITLEELSDATPGDANTVSVADLGAPAGGVRSFKGTVDLTGYPLDSTAPIANEVVVGAKDGSDDAEALTVYKQTITEVTAVANTTSVPAGTPAKVTVTVTDQNGKPIAGAQVVADDEVAAGDMKYTDVNGKAVFDADGSPDGEQHTYHVNTTGVSAYEAGTDFRRSVTITSYAAVAQSITATASKLGPVLDIDEYDANPVSITVTDQNGNPVNDQNVRYSWSVDLFDDAATQPAPQTGTVNTGNDGKGDVDIPKPTLGDGVYTLNTFIERDGTPGQTASDLSMTPLVAKIGEADVVFDDGAKKQAQSGTTTVVSGALELADGSALTGRDITLAWAPTGDAIVAPQAAQPAGTTRNSNTGASTKTGNDGTFSVALTDPAAATPANEIGGTLTATPAANTDAASTLTVDFLKSVAPDSADDITINVQALFTHLGDDPDGLGPLEAPTMSDVTPGRPVDLDVTVKNADGSATLTDFPVTVSVDKGMLSPNAEDKDALTPDPAPAEGGLYGEWKSLGTTQMLSTDDAGDTGIVAAIEKDAGFNTSRAVSLTVTVKAGSVTQTVPVTFTSENPLNPGAVDVALDNAQTVTVLPNAPTSESVMYNVFAKDQFGNLVDGESVTVSDGGSAARVNGDAGDGSVASQLVNEDPAITASSAGAASQTVKGEWTSETNTWTDGDLVTAGFQAENPADNSATPAIYEGVDSLKTGSATVTDSASAVNWYVINLGASSFRINTAPSDGPIRVGRAVRETLTAIDQKGEPIWGLNVDWFRSGPDTNQDGESKQGLATSQTGRSSYTFIGTKVGLADISAVVSGGDFSRTVTDSVRFKKAIAAGLDLGNQRDGDDVARVNAPSAARGATVKLFKVRADGTRKLVATKRANSDGNAKFVRNDTNRRGYTKYQAKVGGTMLTFADWTPKKRVR